MWFCTRLNLTLLFAVPGPLYNQDVFSFQVDTEMPMPLDLEDIDKLVKPLCIIIGFLFHVLLLSLIVVLVFVFSGEEGERE